MTDPTAGDVALKVALAAGTAQAEPTVLDPHQRLYSFMLPPGYQVAQVDLARYLPEPDRKTGAPLFTDHVSLGAYVLAHTQPGSALYASQQSGTVTAVLNGHIPDGARPGWGDHRPRLQLQHTPEWQRWASRDGKMLGQLDFAELVEEGLLDIREPDGATLLEVAQTFHANSHVNFMSSRMLTTGQQQLVWDESITATAGRAADLTIPKVFELGLRPYEGTDPYLVVARLRFRVENKALRIGYLLDRPQDVLRSAFTDIADYLRETTQLPLYRGTPAEAENPAVFRGIPA